MKRSYLILIFLFIQTGLFAQKFSFEEWHNGRIILTTNDTLTGKIKYDLESNTVQLNPAGATEQYAFNAQKLVYFDFTDKITGDYRQFVILPYDIKNNNYRIPVFFEVIRHGDLALLTRERLENVVEHYSAYRSFSRPRLVYDYYFLTEKGNIIFFDGKKRSLDVIFEPFSDEVKEYIRKQNLKVDRMTDLARIVAYYNQLKNLSNK